MKALCEAHGVEYRTASWPETLRDAFRWIHALSKDDTGKGALRNLASAMA